MNNSGLVSRSRQAKKGAQKGGLNFGFLVRVFGLLLQGKSARVEVGESRVGVEIYFLIDQCDYLHT